MAENDPAAPPEARRGGLRPLGDSLSRLMKPLLRGRPLAEAQLLLEWPAIVGEELAALARPLKVRFDRPAERLGGVLELACDGGAALELQHRAPQILERVNAWLGYPAVERLRLKQVRRPLPAVRLPAVPPPRPRQAPAPAPALPPSGDAALDLALARLQEALRQKQAAARPKK